MSPALTDALATPPHMRCEPAPNCVECGSPGDIVFRGMRDHRGNVGGEFGSRRCRNPACGILWLDPRPLEADIHLAYSDYNTHVARPASPQSATTRRNARLYSALRAPLRRWYDSSDEGAQLAAMLLHQRPQGRVLDVGCGDGQLLVRLRAQGWQVQGQEVDPAGAATALAAGIPVVVAPLPEAGLPAESFDAITMNHVIEHLHSPESVLQACHRLLKPGGVLVALTPNGKALGLEHFGDAWVGLDPPRHILLFTCQALKALALRAGFASVTTRTTAARADVMARDSVALAAARSGGGSSVATVAQSLLFYARSNREVRRNAESGEECILWAVKQAP